MPSPRVPVEKQLTLEILDREAEETKYLPSQDLGAEGSLHVPPPETSSPTMSQDDPNGHLSTDVYIPHGVGLRVKGARGPNLMALDVAQHHYAICKDCGIETDSMGGDPCGTCEDTTLTCTTNGCTLCEEN